jgi:8-oxo-dGTP diphosphatase
MTRLVGLRPVALADVDAMHPLLDDWEVIQWLSSPPWPFGRADMAGFFALMAQLPEDGVDLFRIITRDGAPIGVVSITHHRTLGPELGYWLGRAYWGQRIMSEAALELTRRWFANPGHLLLHSGALEDNASSLRIQSGLGFVEAHRQTQFFRPHGCDRQVVRTALTRERFLELHDHR